MTRLKCNIVRPNLCLNVHKTSRFSFQSLEKTQLKLSCILSFLSHHLPDVSEDEKEAVKSLFQTWRNKQRAHTKQMCQEHRVLS